MSKQVTIFKSSDVFCNRGLTIPMFNKGIWTVLL
jgi:hypothetical protein